MTNFCHQSSPLWTKLKAFREIRRSYYSFLILSILIVLSLGAELISNNRALLVSYRGQIYLPTYGAFLPGRVFGLDYDYETDYRQLQQQFAAADSGDFVILPPIPYGPFESDFKSDGTYPPFPPSLTEQHFLGTDTVGRDIAARLLYGFRIAILFSLGLVLVSYTIGILIGSFMGFYGGLFDLLMQRFLEIWSNVPFLYIVIILSSVLIPNVLALLAVMSLFSWMHICWYLRSAVYREKNRDYIRAEKAVGRSPLYIIARHLLPNTADVILTFAPFSVASGMTALTALDFLNFGLPPPTPSWGELLNQGVSNLDAFWIVGSIVTALVAVLIMVTFIGEGLRSVFDPKPYTVYE